MAEGDRHRLRLVQAWLFYLLVMSKHFFSVTKLLMANVKGSTLTDSFSSWSLAFLFVLILDLLAIARREGRLG